MDTSLVGRFSVAGAAVVLAAALAAPGSVGNAVVEQPASTAAAKPAPGTPAAPQQPPGAVTFVDTAVPPISIDADGHGKLTVFVANTTTAAADVVVSVKLRSASGEAIETKTTSSLGSIPAGGEPVAVTADTGLVKGLPPRDAFPLSGVLILVSTPAAGGDPAAKGVKTLAIAAIQRRDDGAEWPLLQQSFVMALSAIVLATLVLLIRKPTALTLWIGGPKWSFSESWSSTLTIAGAILTSLLGFTGIPDYGHAMSKKTYGIASLLFATVIMLAPGVFSLFRRVTTVKDASGAMVQQTQGLVVFFLAAALLTTTGVLSQLRLLDTLFGDLGSASIISTQTAHAFSLACRALIGVLTIYAGVSTYLTAVEQADFQKAAAKAAADAAAAGGPAPAGSPPAAPPQLPDWNLL
jgi:hypothetical protein